MSIHIGYTIAMISLSKQVGRRIKELREARNIKQFELAEFLEIEPTNLSKIENGAYLPREDKLRKIASYLNVEIRDLFDVEHIKTRDDLLKSISSILEKSNDDELIFYYKILKSYKELAL
ncbi:helix-turn-helix transcriptional regulator [bacterium]|nr:helix-turn-helix transcriptional regulator [bacterium]